MVVNPEKFQIMFLGCGRDEIRFTVGGHTIPSSKSVRLLGVTIDNKLSFSTHIEDMCKKANQKINALLRIRRYLDISKATLLCNAYILSCFKYCPLLWMFCSKTDSKRIRSTHIRAVRAITIDFITSRDAILEAYNRDSIHTINLRFLLVEVYKSINKLNPEFMWDLFAHKKLERVLRAGKILALPTRQNSTTQSFAFRAALAWNYLPANLKQASTLLEFKSGIHSLSSYYCQCKSCV